MRTSNRHLIFKMATAAILSLGVNLASAEEGILRVGGSTTLLPIISTVASDFMAKYKTWNKVNAALPDKPIVIFVTAGGSSFGVKSVMNDTIDIGMVSRELKDKEVEKLGTHQSILVGKDAVAIATSARNPLASLKTALSSDEVARIFSGEVSHFRGLNKALPNKQIVLLVRDAGAGSTELLQEEIMKERQISKNALQLSSQGALLQKLQNNHSAVAYISSGLIMQSENALKSIALDGVAASNENVMNGKYKLARPMYLLVKGTPSPYMKAFADYVLADGQKVVERLGYVPAQ